ncbi:MAG: hypothetical protein O7I42_11935 [Alphaproteobacteria bacterium]|nr:hypothetical protein [Alphaproteobacteria bacterium]
MDAIASDAEGPEQPTADEVRAQLRHIQESRDFETGDLRRKFLGYVVEETLAGRTRYLKGVSIAMSVFDRDETFDPQIDPVVRLEARRLRRDLDGYYAASGRTDPIRISIPKGGYVPLFEWQEGTGREKTDMPPVAEATMPPADSPKSIGMMPSRGVLLGAIILALIATATAGWYLFGPESRESTVAQTTDDALLAMPKGPMIAVLPFLHLSGDAKRQYVSDGITEQLTTELARFRDLWVLALGAMQKYKAEPADPRELRREFGADYALEGSILETGSTIRITARLIDTESARYIWVKSYDAALTPANIYEVQDAIARTVVGNLAGKYGVLAKNDMAQSRRRAPDNLDNYDCVLRYYDNQDNFNIDRRSEVMACLEQAVARDPEYAEAWAVLANLYMQQIRFKFGRQEAVKDVFAKANAAVKRAIKLDPTDPTGHMMYSNLLFSAGDLVGFRQEGETALRLNPNKSISLAHYGMRLVFIGEFDRGRSLLKKAQTLNPLHPHWYRIPEVLYRYDRGEYRQALAELDKIEIPGFFWTHLLRAAIFGQLDRLEGAREAAQSLLKLKPKFRQEALSLIEVWRFPEPLNQSILVGLGKAGLDILQEAAAQTD